MYFNASPVNDRLQDPNTLDTIDPANNTQLQSLVTQLERIKFTTPTPPPADTTKDKDNNTKSTSLGWGATIACILASIAFAHCIPLIIHSIQGTNT